MEMSGRSRQRHEHNTQHAADDRNRNQLHKQITSGWLVEEMESDYEVNTKQGDILVLILFMVRHSF